MTDSSVAIITDSTACIPASLALENAIDVVPLTLTLDDQTFADGELDSGRFYDLLRASRHSSTAAPSPGVYLDYIRRASRRARSILCITVSAQFTAMYDSATGAAALARQEMPDLDVRVFDSRNATMAQGFIALEAARVAAAGASIDEVIARAEALVPRVATIAVLDTLTYIARSGRVPRVAAWATELLQVKPIAEFRQREIKLISRTRTRRAAIDRLSSILEGRVDGKGRLHICVQHTNAPGDAEALAQRIGASLHPAELYVSEFTRVMGVHTGPGLLALSYYLDR